MLDVMSVEKILQFHLEELLVLNVSLVIVVLNGGL
jgi:hypothetical protein